MHTISKLGRYIFSYIVHFSRTLCSFQKKFNQHSYRQIQINNYNKNTKKTKTLCTQYILLVSLCFLQFIKYLQTKKTHKSHKNNLGKERNIKTREKQTY